MSTKVDWSKENVNVRTKKADRSEEKGRLVELNVLLAAMINDYCDTGN